MTQQTLHVFGASTALNYSEEHGLGDSRYSWPHVLAEKLNYALKVHAEPGVCNSYIGSELIQTLDSIASTDLVIVLWGVWSRVMFCVDSGGDLLDSIRDDSLVCHSHSGDPSVVWIRSKGACAKSWNPFSSFSINYNRPYYDTFFQKYYSDHKQHLADMEKILLVKMLLDNNNINYIFSSLTASLIDENLPESKNIEAMLQDANWFFPNDLGILEFSNKKKWYISKNDHHFSINGHSKIAELFHDRIKNTRL
jgi:hypothetical protein